MDAFLDPWRLVDNNLHASELAKTKLASSRHDSHSTKLPSTFGAGDFLIQGPDRSETGAYQDPRQLVECGSPACTSPGASIRGTYRILQGCPRRLMLRPFESG
jgi:hypothetical protein